MLIIHAVRDYGAWKQVFDAAAGLRSVRCLGLMTMAPFGAAEGSLRGVFGSLRRLAEELRARSALGLPELSMGMSGDFETAIEEGATLVRIGTAVFGAGPTTVPRNGV